MDVIPVVQVTIVVLGFLGGIVGWLWTRAYKAKVIAERPYPCKVVLDLEEKMRKHDGYFTNDRTRLEKLELFEASASVKLDGVEKDIGDIKASVDKILMLIIERRGQI